MIVGEGVAGSILVTLVAFNVLSFVVSCANCLCFLDMRRRRYVPRVVGRGLRHPRVGPTPIPLAEVVRDTGVVPI
jgi:hypothetical protein